MKGNSLISDGLMEKMRSWNHSGFSVHGEVVIRKEDREALVRLSQYEGHASFSAEKIRYVEKTGCVMYKSKLHQGKNRTLKTAMVRYYGLCANAHRGKVRKAGLSPFALWTVEGEAKRIPSKG